MNDEILLTPEAIKGHAADAVMDATNTDDEMKQVLAAHIEQACRAQVRKLYEWLGGDCTEHDPPAYIAALPMSRVDCPECWQALRAAGEGFKKEGNRPMNLLKEYLTWLAATPKMLVVMLGDWYLQAGMLTGACCALTAFFVAGWFGDAMWLRVFGGFFSLNGALFVAWRVFLRLKSEEGR